MSDVDDESDPDDPDVDAADEADVDAGDDELEGLDDATADEGDDALVEAAPSSRWARLGGALALAYVGWYAVDLVVFSRSPSTFNAAHRLYSNPAMRLAFAVVFLGIVFHGLNGVRLAVIDLRPSLARRDAMLRAAVRFLTFATWIPAALALCWPSVRDWIAR